MHEQAPPITFGSGRANHGTLRFPLILGCQENEGAAADAAGE